MLRIYWVQCQESQSEGKEEWSRKGEKKWDDSQRTPAQSQVPCCLLNVMEPSPNGPCDLVRLRTDCGWGQRWEEVKRLYLPSLTGQSCVPQHFISSIFPGRANMEAAQVLKWLYLSSKGRETLGLVRGDVTERHKKRAVLQRNWFFRDQKWNERNSQEPWTPWDWEDLKWCKKVPDRISEFWVPTSTSGL